MTAGDLRDRISILKKSATGDGQGGRSVTWVDLVTETVAGLTRFAANVKPLRMGERLQAAAMGSNLGYHVTLRYRADVTPAMRISWRPYKATTTKTLEIHGLQPMNGERAFLVLDCSEVL